MDGGAGPTTAAQRALGALMQAVPSDGSLRLCVGQPAVAVSVAGPRPLGRSPLSPSQLQALLGAERLAAAVAFGPKGSEPWTIQVADGALVARLEWLADESWQAVLSRLPAAAGPAGPKAEVVAAVLTTPASEPSASVGQAASPSESTDQAATSELPSDFVALLRTAREREAADLHLQAGQPPRLRLQGRLVASGELVSQATLEAYVTAILPPALVEALRARGSVDFAHQEPRLGRFRVNVGRQAGGLKLCFRLIAVKPSTLAALRLPEDVAAVTQYHQGLVVFAGPKGHGKTTSMASIVDAINVRSAVHIITVEDPIEVVHVPKRAIVSQRQLGSHTKSFARALKGALRQDPDVIVIGELRDRETVEIALTAAETGHLVLATMSTRSAAKTVDRLIEFFPPDDQQQVRATLAGALKMVVSQRLVPGSQGRLVPAAEVVTGSVPFWTLIRENKLFQLPSLQQRGRSIGMLRLDASLEQLVKEGALAPRDALAASEQPVELLRNLQEKHRYSPPPEELQALGLAR